MKALFSTTAAFVVVILTGGAWIGLAQNLPVGGAGTGVAIMGGVFTAAFMWLLIQRLRALLARPDRRWIELGLLVFNFALLVFAFAWVHHSIGLMDLSGPAPRGTTDFSDALYFSIVTITTLGYGDFIPMGAGRAVAAMQGLLGYFILGILVSTGFQLIAPDTSPGEEERREAEREEAEREAQEVEQEEDVHDGDPVETREGGGDGSAVAGGRRGDRARG